MAYGSTFNNIVGNKIRNSADGGEALIQAYLGCSNNLISSNQITANGSTGNQYFIYIGPKCDQCVVSDNQCFGNAERGGICVESDWNDTVTNTYSYAYGKTLPGEWSNAALTGVVVQGNLVTLNFSRPAIMLFAIQGTANSCNLTGASVDGNTVPTLPFYQFEIFEFGTARVNNIQLTGNNFNIAATAGQFILPRGWSHFSNRALNNCLDTTVTSLSVNSTTPSVKFGNTSYILQNTVPTSITFFNDGAQGVGISLKLDVNTTLVYNPSFLRLKGNVNVTGVNADNFITFRQYSDIWFEVSRNF
jgi:hypothetical protein